MRPRVSTRKSNWAHPMRPNNRRVSRFECQQRRGAVSEHRRLFPREHRNVTATACIKERREARLTWDDS